MNEVRGNTLVARFGGYRAITTSSLWQYDYGQVLKFEGVTLPEAYEVHFSKSDSVGTSITQIGTADGVSIPDMFLLTPGPVYAWIYLHDGLEDGETEYKVTIPVTQRARPVDDEPTPVEQSAITEAIAALNVAVEETAAGVLQAEGYALGTEDGEPVNSDSIYFEANAKFFKEAAEDARDASVLAKERSESARDASIAAKEISVSAKQASEAARTEAVTAKNAAVSAKQASEAARTEAVTAKNAAVTARNNAETFQNEALAARNEAVSSKNIAVAAKNDAVSAKNDAVSAKNTAVSAKEIAVAAKETAVAAKNAAEEARDDFLNLDVQVQTLPAGSSATAEYNSGVMSLGIPRGATGERGQTGATGPKGDKGDRGAGIPSGGSSGQILKKRSGTNYDTEWGNAPSPVRFYVCSTGEYMVTTKMPNIPNPDPSTFYLVPDGTGSDSMIEWVNIGGSWERFGSTRIDLSVYVQKTDIATASTPGLVKPEPSYGTRMGDAPFQNTLIVAKADDVEVKTGSGNFKPIVPSNEHAAAFYGLAKAAGDTTQSLSDNPVGSYTNDAKNAIKEMLGVEEGGSVSAPVTDVEVNGVSVLNNGVAEVSIPVTDVEVNGVSALNNGVAEVSVPVTDVEVNGVSVLSNGVAEIPIADDTNAGVVKVDNSYGFRIDDTGILKAYAASDSTIKQGSNSYRPIASNHVHDAAFYGLAKAAGDATQAASNNAVGTYTDGAKAAIQTMLGLTNLIRSTGITNIWTGTQAQYDLLTPDANTLY